MVENVYKLRKRAIRKGGTGNCWDKQSVLGSRSREGLDLELEVPDSVSEAGDSGSHEKDSN